MVDTGSIPVESAISWGFTGPCLRASGVNYDVRKNHPYLCYDKLDFELIDSNGNNIISYIFKSDKKIMDYISIKLKIDNIDKTIIINPGDKGQILEV